MPSRSGSMTSSTMRSGRNVSAASSAPRPVAAIARVTGAHMRLLEAVDRLTDEQVLRPSLLPGWTVGHVLTHVARNADSHVRRTEAAIRGEMVDQYPGGYAAREAEIEAGAG